MIKKRRKRKKLFYFFFFLDHTSSFWHNMKQVKKSKRKAQN